MDRATTRTRDTGDASLREMTAHLNVIDATIDALAADSDMDTALAGRDLLNRLDVLAYGAARLRIADLPRVTDALEAVVLTMQARRTKRDEEVTATLRHGVDILMLLTHDAVRRMQGYPGAELRAATEALLERVERLLGSGPAIGSAA